jgi:succinate dehydrogenase/fumarate reductase flavoprotein subunit
MDSLTAAARENPLAAALIGGGALWLLMGGDKLRNAVAPLVEIGTRAQRSAASSWGETSGSVRASQMQDQAARSIDLASRSINDTVRNARMAASDAMSGAAETMNERLDEGVAGAREMFDRLGQALPKKETLRQAQFSLSDLMERQPLVLGAVGLAIGATVAGALAKSSLEDEWVGN